MISKKLSIPYSDLSVESNNPDVEAKLRNELKKLLMNPNFKQLNDPDQMADALMHKLAEMADNEELDSSILSHSLKHREGPASNQQLGDDPPVKPRLSFEDPPETAYESPPAPFRAERRSPKQALDKLTTKEVMIDEFDDSLMDSPCEELTSK